MSLFLTIHWLKIFCFLASEKAGASRSTSEIGKAMVVILVISASGHLAQRKAIRETWASRIDGYNDIDVRTFFAIAIDNFSRKQIQQLLLENSAHDDLLLLAGASDDYRSLTRKLKVALDWLQQSMTFTFLLKVDDDSFVMIPELIEYLISLQRSEKVYLGFFRGSASVKRQGKWAEHDWFLCSHYLPHARGGGYLLSRDLVNYIVRNKDWLKEYANEDVSVGAWLAPLDISRIHEPRFDTEYHSRGCSNLYLVTHKVSPEEMRRHHENLKATGKLCRKEEALYPSYRYNWSTDPINCCKRSWLVP